MLQRFNPQDPEFRAAVGALTTFEPLALPPATFPLNLGDQHLCIRVAALQLTRLGLYHGPVQATLDEPLFVAFCGFRSLLDIQTAANTAPQQQVHQETLALLGDPYEMGARFFQSCKPSTENPGGLCLVTPCSQKPAAAATGLHGLSFGMLSARGCFEPDQTKVPTSDSFSRQNRFGLALVQIQMWMAGCYLNRQDAMAGADTVAALITWLEEQYTNVAETLCFSQGKLYIAPHCFVIFGFHRPTDAEVDAQETHLLSENPALTPPPQTVSSTTAPGQRPKKTWLGRTWNDLKRWGNRGYASVRAGLVHAGRAVAKGALDAWQTVSGLWQTALRCFTAVRNRLADLAGLFWRRVRIAADLMSGVPIASGTQDAFVATWWHGSGDLINVAQGPISRKNLKQQEEDVVTRFTAAVLGIELLGPALRTLRQAATADWLGLAVALFKAWRPYLGRNTMTPVWVR